MDLDFNYVRAEVREATLADRPEIESAIIRIARAGSYHVQLSADEHAGRKLFLSYRNAAGLADRIEVDVNYLHRVPLAEPDEIVLWQPVTIGDRACARWGWPSWPRGSCVRSSTVWRRAICST